ncbi:MAG TPA: hypothetical protein VNZ44_19920 [Pyrinomonadaceae bacterium]|nr:hypothetical protein [Pyrinomonadaceae bacterium]
MENPHTDETRLPATPDAETSPPLTAERSPVSRLVGLVYTARHRDIDLSWDEYKIHIDLYKFYLDLTLKAIVFFYAIGGTILTVIYGPAKSVAEGGPAAPALPPAYVQKIFVVTPFVIGCLLAASFIVGATLWGVLTHTLNRKLERQKMMVVPPFTHVLTVVLFAFGVIFAFVAKFLWDIIVANHIPFW